MVGELIVQLSDHLFRRIRTKFELLLNVFSSNRLELSVLKIISYFY